MRIKFMQEALNQADLAYKKNEIPIGAVLVKDDLIIGRGHNHVIHDLDVSAHAEIYAIREASKNIKNYRLNNCDMYVTIEPCHMCSKAILDARIRNLFIGAPEPRTGAVFSIDNFFDDYNHNHYVQYEKGILEKECSALIKNFFLERR